jgi:hypothetical protein
MVEVPLYSREGNYFEEGKYMIYAKFIIMI